MMKKMGGKEERKLEVETRKREWNKWRRARSRVRRLGEEKGEGRIKDWEEGNPEWECADKTWRWRGSCEGLGGYCIVLPYYVITYMRSLIDDFNISFCGKRSKIQRQEKKT